MHLFGSRNPEFYEEFSRFPFLSKNEILDRPITERTYADPRSIQLYAISSGTSKHAIPTIIPHTVRNYHELDQHGYANIKKEGPINLMLLLNGVNSSLISFMDNWENKNIVFTIGNVSNLRASAVIAREIGVSAIVTTPSILYAFIKELRAANFDLDTIVWVSLGSEYCTKVMYDVFRENFKKSDFNFRYGNTEFHGKIGIRCEHLNKNAPPGVFHLNPHAIIEIVDETGSPVQMGEVGEIVITDTFEKAFPLLRFRLGDYGSLREEKCPCGNRYILEMAGRANHDFLKFHGVTLRTEMIYESLREHLDIFENRFEVHVYEKKEGSEVKPYFILKTTLQNSQNIPSDEKLGAVATSVAKKLMLSPTRSYFDMVEMGNFCPMTIELIEKWENTRKNIGIVSHL